MAYLAMLAEAQFSYIKVESWSMEIFCILRRRHIWAETRKVGRPLAAMVPSQQVGALDVELNVALASNPDGPEIVGSSRAQLKVGELDFSVGVELQQRVLTLFAIASRWYQGCIGGRIQQLIYSRKRESAVCRSK